MWRIPFGGYVPAGNEIEAISKLMNMGTLTVGQITEQFEEQFASYIGSKRAISCNSGSSALLLSVAALCSPENPNRLKPGDEAVVCAECFPIDIAVLVQHGLKVKLIDVDRTTCLFDMDELEDAVSDRTRLIMAVHLCGNVIDLDRLYEIREKNGVDYVIEDCCDALGSKYGGEHVGLRATFSCFSFYPAHHITTGEGGVVAGNEENPMDIVLSLRNWGRVKQPVSYSDFAMRFKYVNWGYNLKWMELSAALGLEQMKALESFSVIRRRNYARFAASLYEGKLSHNFVRIRSSRKADPCWMMIPIVLSEKAKVSRNMFVKQLESMGVETRPLFVGNILRQPIGRITELSYHNVLDDADYLYENGFLIGNHHSMSEVDVEYLYNCFKRILG